MTFSTEMRSPAINSDSFMKIKTLKNAQKVKKFTFIPRSGRCCQRRCNLSWFYFWARAKLHLCENSLIGKLLCSQGFIIFSDLFNFRWIQRDNKVFRPLNSKFLFFHSLKIHPPIAVFPSKKKLATDVPSIHDAQTIETC